jgi:hypothetical protein
MCGYHGKYHAQNLLLIARKKMACFGAYQPQGPLIVLVSLYTVFVGLVLYLILTLSDPYQGIGVDPTTFEFMVEKMQARNE